MKKIVAFIIVCCTSCFSQAQLPDANLLPKKAPETFKVLFKTSKGNFTIQAYRKWSPAGVDRLYQLVVSGYYTNNLIFRVEPQYVVQFGITDNRQLNFYWDRKRLKDEPVLQKHQKGMVAFARDVANSRAAQLFIDVVDNPKLDTIVREGVMGYPPIAKVISGMEVIARFNDRYKKQILPLQDSVYLYGNRYLQQHFPGLDLIYQASIVR